MKRLLLIAALLTLAGCKDSRPESTATVGNGAEVARLFTHDGCTVYRFYDRGHYRYFTNCSGSTMSVARHGEVRGLDAVMGGAR